MNAIRFDARWIGPHGIGRFAHELEQRLNLPHLHISGSPTSPFDPIRLLYAICFSTRRDECIFSPGYNAPLMLFRPYIFTIHDLNHIDRLENSSLLKRLYYRLIIRRACRKAYRVLTVSEFSRQRIIAWAGVEPNRVVIVGNGVDSSFRSDAHPYEPGYPYLLCVSNRKAHKNEPRILEAFARAQIDSDIHLIFTGEANETLHNLCRQYGVESRVIFAGRIQEKDLPSLYCGAIALVFPSLYEGFGLPVIEAMACGIPVLTSNTTSLPEVAGDAALLVNPFSVNEISVGIVRLCVDNQLREALQRKGLERAALFSWETVTTKVNAVFEEFDRELRND